MWVRWRGSGLLCGGCDEGHAGRRGVLCGASEWVGEGVEMGEMWYVLLERCDIQPGGGFVLVVLLCWADVVTDVVRRREDGGTA